jgi:hypothetical protein
MSSVSTTRYGPRSQYPSQSQTGLNRFETLRETGGGWPDRSDIKAIPRVDYQVAFFSQCLGVVVSGSTSDPLFTSVPTQERPFAGR